MSVLTRLAGRSSRERGTEIIERRDPQAATIRSTWQSPGRALVPDWNGDEAVKYAYLVNVVVYRCVQVIADAVASCPARVGPDPGKPARYNPAHPLARLLGPPPGTPNPRVTARALWRWSIACRIVHGRYAWEIEEPAGRNGGTPLALWPLNPSPDMLHAIPSQGGSNYFDRFEYGPAGRRRALRSDQVMYAYRPSLADFRQPESALQSARLDIAQAVMTDRYHHAFLRNDATPASLVVSQMFPSKEERDRFRRQWVARHQGPDNKGQVAFAEVEGDERGNVSQSVDVKMLGLPQKDAQLVERYATSLRNIAIGIGVPFSKLDASGRTFDNAGVENRAFWLDTVLPLLIEVADEVNMQLATRFGGSDVLWFGTDHIPELRPSQKFQPTQPLLLVKGRVLDVGELRDDQGVPSDMQGAKWRSDPWPGHDLVERSTAAKTLVDAGFDPVAVLTAVGLPTLALAAPPEPAEPPAAPPTEPPAMPPIEPTLAAPPLAVVLPPPRPRAAQRDRETADERRQRTRITDAAHLKALESTFQRSLQRLFARQERAVLDRLAGKRGRRTIARAPEPETGTPNVEGVFDVAFWTAATAEQVAELIEGIAAVGGARVAATFGSSFDPSDAAIQALIAQRAHRVATEVTQTTADNLGAALAEGVKAEEAMPQIADRVQTVFTQADSVRAPQVARTEVVGAYNASAVEVATHLGPDTVGGKEWIAEHDARTRATHAEADGQAVGMNETFRVGGYAMRQPGDASAPAEEVINCRCTVGFLTPEEFAARRDGSSSLDRLRVESVFRRLASHEVELASALMEIAS